MWDYLCNVDLVDEWYAEERPVDDVMQFAVADTRAFRTKWIFDEQWLRILDVDAALTARRYADVDGSVTIGVGDEILAQNVGVWEISAAGAKRLADRADAGPRRRRRTIVGGLPRWHGVGSLVAAGRVDVRNSSAVAVADALFAVPEAPYCCSGSSVASRRSTPGGSPTPSSGRQLARRRASALPLLSADRSRRCGRLARPRDRP